MSKDSYQKIITGEDKSFKPVKDTLEVTETGDGEIWFMQQYEHDGIKYELEFGIEGKNIMPFSPSIEIELQRV